MTERRPTAAEIEARIASMDCGGKRRPSMSDKEHITAVTEAFRRKWENAEAQRVQPPDELAPPPPPPT